MLMLLRLFLDILFLRRGPQDVPQSTFLLVWAAALYFVINLVVGSWQAGLYRGALAAALDVGLSAALLLALLRNRGLGERFVQTYTAFVGTGVLFGLMALPLIALFTQAAGPAPAETQVSAAPVLAWFVLLFWSLTVLSHILRNALSAPLPLAVLMAVAYTLISLEVSGRVLQGS